MGRISKKVNKNIKTDKRKLNIGCGMLQIHDDCINVDMNPKVKPDLCFDIEDLPWPFESGQFEKVYAIDILEHITAKRFFPIMDEIHRVLKAGGFLQIRTSCWNTQQSYTDPTHQRFCTPHTFDYCDTDTEIGQKYRHYTHGKYIIQEIKQDVNELCFTLVKDKWED